MDLIIYDPDLRPIGIIDEVRSLLWRRTFREPGTMSLEVPYSDKAVEFLSRGNFIRKAGMDELRRIDNRSFTRTGEDINVIRVDGSDPLSWAAWRVFSEDVEMEGKPVEVCGRLVDGCIGQAASAARRIPFVTVTWDDTDAGAEEYSWTAGTGILDAVSPILIAHDIGCTCKLNGTATGLVIHFGPSRNRTARQSALHPAIFRPDWGTIGEHTYTESDGAFKNMGYAYWQGPPVEYASGAVITPPPELFTIGGELTGVDRREVLLSTYPTVKKSEAITRAREDLAAFEMDQNFSGSIDTGIALTYGVDYDLGDRVTIVNPAWDVELEETITAIEERYDDGVLRISATFGDGEPSFMRELTRQLRRVRL